MKNVSRKQNWKKIILLSVVLSIVVAGSLLVLEKSGRTDFVKEPARPKSGPAEKQQNQNKDVSNGAKGNFLDSQYSKRANQNTSNTQDTPSVTSPEIVLSAQQEGSNVIITAKITTNSSGTCSLTVNNLGQTYTQSADVIYQPEYSSCAGFAVPVSSVSSGNWSISLTVNGSGGKTASQTTTLEVR